MEISIKNATIKDLINKNETPFYFYNKRILVNTIHELKNAFKTTNFELLFATMANDNIEFLEIINQNAVGACINSIKHLKLVRDIGIPSNLIQYTSSGISKSDMELLIQEEITVNLDSLSQINQWFSIKGSFKCGIRINTGSLGAENGEVNRLGIDKNSIGEAQEIAEKFGKTINGIHIYIGTNFSKPDKMLLVLKEFFEVACKIPTLEYVNIGGGIGIDYLGENIDFDVKLYGLKVVALLEELRIKINKNLKLYFEPGRRLAAPSGYFVTRVTDIKFLNDTRYVVVDASIANFPRPLLNPESPHEIAAPFKNGSILVPSIVVGKTTFSKDILSDTALPEEIAIDDIVIFNNSGAYCDSMRSRFLGQVDPNNVFVDE